MSTGANLDQNGAVNVPFNPASVLTFDGAYTATSDVAAITIAVIYIAQVGAQPTLICSKNCTVGSTVPPALNLAATSINMVIDAGVIVTLNGAAPSQTAAANAVNAAGAKNSFAPGLGSTVPANTYFINNIDFPNAGGILEINTINAGAIQFNAATNNTTITNGANGIVNVNSELNVKDPSWATELGKINIANGVLYSYINNAIGPVDVNPIGNIVFKGATSRADFSNEGGGSKVFFATEPITSAVDATGIVAFHVSSAVTEITAEVGVDNTHRLNTFITDGLNVTTISSNIFAQNIEISQNNTKVDLGTTQLIWTTPIDTGAGGLVYFINQDVTQAVVSEFQKNITSDIDFKGTSVVNILDDNVKVTGNIDSSVAGGNGTLNFAGSSVVTGNIGATNAIATINQLCLE